MRKMQEVRFSDGCKLFKKSMCYHLDKMGKDCDLHDCPLPDYIEPELWERVKITFEQCLPILGRASHDKKMLEKVEAILKEIE